MTMFNLLAGIFFIALVFISGTYDGKHSARIEIGEACLNKGSFEVKGHTFKCERTKVKEGL